MTKPQMYKATLVRGRQYRLLKHKGSPNEYFVFVKGQPVPVSAEVKNYLEQSAVDPVQTTFSTGEIETENVCKFEFEISD